MGIQSQSASAPTGTGPWNSLRQRTEGRRAVPGPFVIGLTLLLVLGCTDAVLAWGPAVHIGLADAVLGNLGLLPAGIAVALQKHRAAYRYGSIAADVVFAKRWSKVKQFCHHWSTAFNLLEKAQSQQAEAFAYGYLSHLAADTVAHGKYVPRQVLLSGSTLNFGHLYWELRADAVQDETTWRRLSRLLQTDHAEHHGALRGHLRETFLPYQLNVLLFYRMNSMATRPAVRRTLDAWGRSLGSELSTNELAGYQAEALERTQAVLSQGSRSSVVQEDPNGTSALMRVSVHRRDTRRRRRRGIEASRGIGEVSRAFGAKVAAADDGG